MKLGLSARCVRRMLALVALGSAFGLVGAPTRAAEQHPTAIRIATGEWPPYTSKNLNGDGIACKLISEAFAEFVRNVRIGEHGGTLAFDSQGRAIVEQPDVMIGASPG